MAWFFWVDSASGTGDAISLVSPIPVWVDELSIGRENGGHEKDDVVARQ
jgi:hypothetical protein